MSKELAKAKQRKNNKTKRSALAALCVAGGVVLGLGLAQIPETSEVDSAAQQKPPILARSLPQKEASPEPALDRYVIPEEKPTVLENKPEILDESEEFSIEAPKPETTARSSQASPDKSKEEEAGSLRSLAARFGAHENELESLSDVSLVLEMMKQGPLDNGRYASLVELLDDEDPAVRLGALRLLSSGEARDVDPAKLDLARSRLLALLDDPSSSEASQRAALKALPIRGEDPAMRARLQDLVEEEGALAEAALNRLGAMPGGRDFLASVVQTSTGERRSQALQALVNPEGSDARDPGQRALLLSLARDPDPSLRKELFRQLKYGNLLGESPMAPALVDGLAEVYAEESSEDARRSLESTLSFNAGPENVATFERWAADPSLPEDRRARFSELARKAADQKNRSPLSRAFEALGEVLKDAKGLKLGEELNKALGE